jgi:hypothetical protein
MAAAIRAHYTGNGKQFHAGLPMRDITVDEYERLSDEQKKLVQSSGLYELVKAAATTAARDEAHESKERK